MKARRTAVAGPAALLAAMASAACSGSVVAEKGNGGADASGSSGATGAGGGCTRCGSTCVDTDTDPLNCGACGHDCLGGQCLAGACQPVALASGEHAPGVLAVDATNVYWVTYCPICSPSNGEVKKVPIAGGTPTTLASGLWNADGIAVDGANVYWNDAGAIMKVSIAGGVPMALFTPNKMMGSSSAIAVDATSVYWFTLDGGASVMKISIDGGTPITLATGAVAAVFDITLDANDVYWSNGTGIVRVPKSGGTPTQIVPVKLAWDLALDATTIYWTTNDGLIEKAPLATGAATQLATAQLEPTHLAIDSHDVYWTRPQRVMKVPIAGGSAVQVAQGSQGAYAIAVDGTAIYWTNSDDPDGSVMKVAK